MDFIYAAPELLPLLGARLVAYFGGTLRVLLSEVVSWDLADCLGGALCFLDVGVIGMLEAPFALPSRPLAMEIECDLPGHGRCP